jgi:hypothetical protein
LVFPNQIQKKKCRISHPAMYKLENIILDDKDREFIKKLEILKKKRYITEEDFEEKKEIFLKTKLKMMNDQLEKDTRVTVNNSSKVFFIKIMYRYK